MKHSYAVAMAIFSLTKMGQCSKGFSMFCTPTKESVLQAWFLSTWHWWNQSQSVSIPFAPKGVQLYKNSIIKQHACYTNIYFFLFACQSKNKKKKIQLQILFLHSNKLLPNCFLENVFWGTLKTNKETKKKKKIRGGGGEENGASDSENT